ncbi:MAG TPA: alpha/beta hydrolase-fold protein [Gemmatimonadaceae bacterium]|nr:alpha/beta hydrolase-fold protein [Gemmatimonadaceae bacterium]
MHSLIAVAVLALTTSPPGETRVVRIPSKILGEERVVHVSLPLNYGVARRRYETTYLLDGHVRQFFDITVAAAGYDVVADLQHDYATPPQIVVGVDQIDRGADLGRNQELFTRFLVEELIPYIDREFRTNRYRTLIGHSLGGRFALMTFCRAPGVFPAVIAISAAGGDSTSADAVTRCLSTAFNAPGTALRQLVLSAGDQEPRVIQGMERLRDFLRANAPPHWRWTTIEGAGLGHTDTPMATIPPGIRFIHDKSVWEMPRGLADSVQFGRVADPERAVDAFYSNLSARVGVPMTPSLKWMLAPTRVLIQRGDSAGAERAIRQLIAAYPEDLEAYGMASDLALRRGDKAASRQALNDALRMLGRLDFYDVYERERKRKLIENALLSVGR